MAAVRTSRHRLGFAVKVIGDGGLPSHDTRRWQSGPHLRESLKATRAILDYVDAHDIRMYRLPTGLAPYASHPDLPQFHDQVQECAAELAELGQLARDRGIRLSSHPGQYTVLNSERPETVDAAIAELEVQAALFDAMGLGPESVSLIHVGGAAGGVDAGIDRFVAGFERLSERAQARLAVENDDKSYGIAAVRTVAERTGIPVIWDVLHHHCHDPEGVPDAEALRLALDTWPQGVRPKIHYSSPRLDMELRPRKEGRKTVEHPWLPPLLAHADLIDPLAFELF
ncbi:MAG: UV DNA damage repair endonuclease UvsE, partial [Solirubrobacteraceae bacterium]|nr:UV DNA damage repair endonuclease UvsE [Solirubrobacteraceae bacterium]